MVVGWREERERGQEKKREKDKIKGGKEEEETYMRYVRLNAGLARCTKEVQDDDVDYTWEGKKDEES